jgi:hypothetical protein
MISFCQLGAGRIGANHAENIARHPEARLVAIVDTNDFADIENWLPVSQLPITYVAGPSDHLARYSAHSVFAARGRTVPERFRDRRITAVPA